MSLHCAGIQIRRNMSSFSYKFIQFKTSQCCRLVSTNAKEKWDLLSAICLERRPITAVELSAQEKKFSQLLSNVEFENSLLSDHEVRHKQDMIQAELLKKGEETDVEQTLKQTAQDFEDACQDEFNKFQLSPRLTEADKKNDAKSLDRKLDRNLLLLVEQRFSGKSVWTLPQGVRGDGETMRQAAERVLRESCGTHVKAKFFGNAPCGFYKYKYPKSMRSAAADSPVGAKVFFFKAQHVGGQVDGGATKVKDYKWLGREELEPILQKDYYNCINQFLIDEQ